MKLFFNFEGLWHTFDKEKRIFVFHGNFRFSAGVNNHIGHTNMNCMYSIHTYSNAKPVGPKDDH